MRNIIASSSELWPAMTKHWHKHTRCTNCQPLRCVCFWCLPSPGPPSFDHHPSPTKQIISTQINKWNESVIQPNKSMQTTFVWREQFDLCCNLWKVDGSEVPNIRINSKLNLDTNTKILEESIAECLISIGSTLNQTSNFLTNFHFVFCFWADFLRGTSG